MQRMLRVSHDDVVAVGICGLIRESAVETLRERLDERPELATMRIVDMHGVARSLLHVVADWPGHLARGGALVELLAAAGADVNAAVTHPTDTMAAETPLHWAASSGDVAVLEALLDAGADLEAPGAILTGGTAMSDAVVFAQRRSARALLARGARTTLWQAAYLALLDRVRAACEGNDPPSARDCTNALWHACRGGAREVVEYLVTRGADVNWLGHDHKTPLDAAYDADDPALIDWLRAHGARRAADL
ncbi:MAG: ankyrin repeat domain-containing protein [Gemmatimonadaceae bacterium]|nr:ankyrin repeat domain-containing protein [Gemmatimonadaceae bacterium]